MTVQHELLKDPELLYRLTVDEYHQMLKCRALEDGAPYELLDGHVVRKIRNARGEGSMTIGTQHATAVTLIGELNARLRGHDCHVRLQSPITLQPNDEPEPDGAIVRGSQRDYKKRHPTAADVICVIEVADASLRRDRGYKQRLYAEHGLPLYLIVNLANRTVEVRTTPLEARYQGTEILTSRKRIKVAMPKGKPVVFAASELLP
ncbi:MAG TPA: Uma2 family endonuclease [Tepidisphaeraceae bacterium]|jgi:Uma2 family endonuclease|nr:Uma2 family endonuclease [Tepidisphaeraceae bacterium]